MEDQELAGKHTNGVLEIPGSGQPGRYGARKLCIIDSHCKSAINAAVTMDVKLAQFATLSQKDKGPAYTSLIQQAISQSDPDAIVADLHLLVGTVVNQDSVGLIVGRQVLAELVKVLAQIKDSTLRKRLVEDTLATVQPRIVSYEEQVCYSK